MNDTLKWLLFLLVLGTGMGLIATTCASTPRANCYTCVERCQPFRVAACEPSWSPVQPLYCSCDPFTRVDEAGVAVPKGGK